MAMTEAMKEAIWLRRLLDDLGIEHDLLKINCDSMSVIYLAKNQVYYARRSTSTSGSTLFGRLLRKVTSSYRRFTQRRIRRYAYQDCSGSEVCILQGVTPNSSSCLSSVELV